MEMHSLNAFRPIVSTQRGKLMYLRFKQLLNEYDSINETVFDKILMLTMVLLLLNEYLRITLQLITNTLSFD